MNKFNFTAYSADGKEPDVKIVYLSNEGEPEARTLIQGQGYEVMCGLAHILRDLMKNGINELDLIKAVAIARKFHNVGEGDEE